MTSPGLPTNEKPKVTLEKWQGILEPFLAQLDSRIAAIENLAFSDWEPEFSSVSGTFSLVSLHFAKYARLGELCLVNISLEFDLSGSTSDRINITPPFAAATQSNNPPVGGGDCPLFGRARDAGSTNVGLHGGFELPDLMFARREETTNWTVNTGHELYLSGIYRVANGATLL